ncbi:hypothetical protein EG329_012560 [Mollisiaceae sp. DMI_Dod_QoI]|nr:hypothetical protein EG329_012560 [Helotiales sp. DMI_Dod_QoI]
MAMAQPSLHHQESSKPSKPIRRQYRSCDQCRKGRRACDATSLNHSNVYPLACSTCAKTGKRCTFSWLQTVSKQTAQRTTTRGPGKSARMSGHRRSFQGLRSVDSNFEALTDGICEYPITPNAQLYSPSWVFYPTPSHSYALTTPNVIPADSTATMQNTISQSDDCGSEMVLGAEDLDLLYPLPDSVGCSVPTSNLSNHASRLVSGMGYYDYKTDSACSVRGQPGSGAPPATNGNYSPLSSDEGHFDSRNQACILPDPSAAGIHQRLAASSNKSFIAAGLIRIYHDSLEHALSCWITEATCPYNIETLRMPNTKFIELNQNELGANWSNRMCARVCFLDTAFDSLRRRPLCASENQAASRALNLAVMAFASQWSHISCSDNTADTDHTANAWPLEADFDRMIRENFWHAAHKALQDTADISSFRAIFAHMVFALAQRPMRAEDFNVTRPSQSRPPSSTSGSVAHLANLDLADPEDSTEVDKVSSHLETALRHLSSWRHRLETIRFARARRNGTNTCQDLTPNTIDSMEIPGQKSFNILYWLGVMFDTSFAAINKRPLVISDEDSAIIRHDSGVSSRPRAVAYHPNCFSDSVSSNTWKKYTKSSQLWGTYLLQIQGPLLPQSTVRWPCSYEDAAAYLCAAIPVKVLLFRKVACLQTLLYRRAAPEEMEEYIEDALSIQQHWDLTYGQFITDCVTDHENIPPRIQSWYIILAGHWHLAGLLLADVIETLDDTGATIPSQRSHRQSACTAHTLRNTNADSIAGLARASCPPFSTSFAHAHEFHFAVSQGALLTEPWTDILMRSFVKAGSVFLSCLAAISLSATYALPSKSEAEGLRDQSRMCIQALRLLGKKSDSAHLAAENLCSRLKDLDTIYEPNAAHGEYGFEDGNFEDSDFELINAPIAAFDTDFECLQTVPEFNDCSLQTNNWIS